MINTIWGFFAGGQTASLEEAIEKDRKDCGSLEVEEECIEQENSSSRKPVSHLKRSYLDALNQGIKETKAPVIGREALKDKLKLPFNPIWGAAASTQEVFNEFQAELENHPEIENGDKLKIALGAKKMRVWFGYTPAEVTALSNLKGLEFLKNAFASPLLDSSEENAPSSFSPIYFLEESSRFKENYESLPKVDCSAIPVALPNFDSFNGDESQVSQIISSLLENSKGAIVAIDGSPTSLLALEGQMANLARLGVTRVFLQNCCHNTMNQEFEEFFTTKECSPFLRSFLGTGFGSLYPKVNCYEFAKTAVEAGIKLSGLDHLKTLTFPGQVVESRHIMGSHFSALQIINTQMAKEEGKYVVLVMGPKRVSYTDGIAGLSELCNAPSIYLRECKNEETPSYIQRVVNYENRDEGDAGEGNNHFMHAVINIASDYEMIEELTG